jgi:uncharacterized OB-fold protein
MNDSLEFTGRFRDRVPEGSGAPPLTLHRCASSHAFFHVFDSCPLCGGALESFSSPPEAVLVAHTIVRVSPAGTAFALGLARAPSGAQTLCIIDGGVAGIPGDEVILTKRGALYHAAPRAREP